MRKDGQHTVTFSYPSPPGDFKKWHTATVTLPDDIDPNNTAMVALHVNAVMQGQKLGQYDPRYSDIDRAQMKAQVAQVNQPPPTARQKAQHSIGQARLSSMRSAAQGTSSLDNAPKDIRDYLNKHVIGKDSMPARAYEALQDLPESQWGESLKWFSPIGQKALRYAAKNIAPEQNRKQLEDSGVDLSLLSGKNGPNVGNAWDQFQALAAGVDRAPNALLHSGNVSPDALAGATPGIPVLRAYASDLSKYPGWAGGIGKIMQSATPSNLAILAALHGLGAGIGAVAPAIGASVEAGPAIQAAVRTGINVGFGAPMIQGGADTIRREGDWGKGLTEAAFGALPVAHEVIGDYIANNGYSLPGRGAPPIGGDEGFSVNPDGSIVKSIDAFPKPAGLIEAGPSNSWYDTETSTVGDKPHAGYTGAAVQSPGPMRGRGVAGTSIAGLLPHSPQVGPAIPTEGAVDPNYIAPDNTDVVAQGRVALRTQNEQQAAIQASMRPGGSMYDEGVASGGAMPNSPGIMLPAPQEPIEGSSQMPTGYDRRFSGQTTLNPDGTVNTPYQMPTIAESQDKLSQLDADQVALRGQLNQSSGSGFSVNPDGSIVPATAPPPQAAPMPIPTTPKPRVSGRRVGPVANEQATQVDTSTPEPDPFAADIQPPAIPQEQPASSGFTTAKGSTYNVTPNGTTIRNKAARSDFGHEGQEGLQPESEYTSYVANDDLDKLSILQTQGGGKRLVRLADGSIAVQFTDGPYAGKLAKGSQVFPKTTPEVGLTPVESFNGGTRVHFGNEITNVGSSQSAVGAIAPQPSAITPPATPIGVDDVDLAMRPLRSVQHGFRTGTRVTINDNPGAGEATVQGVSGGIATINVAGENQQHHVTNLTKVPTTPGRRIAMVPQVSDIDVNTPPKGLPSQDVVDRYMELAAKERAGTATTEEGNELFRLENSNPALPDEYDRQQSLQGKGEYLPVSNWTPPPALDTNSGRGGQMSAVAKATKSLSDSDRQAVQTLMSAIGRKNAMPVAMMVHAENMSDAAKEVVNGLRSKMGMGVKPVFAEDGGVDDAFLTDMGEKPAPPVGGKMTTTIRPERSGNAYENMSTPVLAGMIGSPYLSGAGHKQALDVLEQRSPGSASAALANVTPDKLQAMSDEQLLGIGTHPASGVLAEPIRAELQRRAQESEQRATGITGEPDNEDTHTETVSQQESTPTVEIPKGWQKTSPDSHYLNVDGEEYIINKEPDGYYVEYNGSDSDFQDSYDTLSEAKRAVKQHGTRSILKALRDAAMDRINARNANTGDVTLGSGAGGANKFVENAQDYAIVGASHLIDAALDFGEFSAKMARQFGDAIQPHLSNIWDRANAIIDEAKAGNGTGDFNKVLDYRTGNYTGGPATGTPPIGGTKQGGPDGTNLGGLLGKAVNWLGDTGDNIGAVPIGRTNIKDIMNWGNYQFNPEGMSPEAARAARTIRAAQGEEARATAVSTNELVNQVRKAFAPLGTDQLRLIMDDMEQGIYTHSGPKIDAAMKAYRGVVDAATDRMQHEAPDALDQFIDNYVARVVKAPDGKYTVTYPQDVNPTGTPKGFRAQRSYQSIMDAPTDDPDYQFVSDNPADMLAFRLAEANKFVRTNQVVKALTADGTLSTEIRDGWEALDPHVSESLVQAVGEGSRYYAPAPVATILNNWLSRGIRGSAMGATPFHLAQALNNTVNMAKLGLSGVHALNMAQLTTQSKFANMLMNLEDVVTFKDSDALKAALGAGAQAAVAPVGWGDAIVRGRQTAQDYLDPNSQNIPIGQVPNSSTPSGKMQAKTPPIGVRVANTAKEASGVSYNNYRESLIGGDAILNPQQRIEQLRRDMQNKKAVGNRIGQVIDYLKIGGNVARIATNNLDLGVMRHLVPVVKDGAMYDAANTEYRRLINRYGSDADIPQDEFNRVMARVADSIDNRFGQVNYQNMFMNQGWKDAFFSLLRAPGWQLTYREMLGGAKDVVSGGATRLKAGDRYITPRMAGMLAKVITNAGLAATATYIAAHRKPHGEDYIAPPIGVGGERVMTPDAREEANLVDAIVRIAQAGGPGMGFTAGLGAVSEITGGKASEVVGGYDELKDNKYAYSHQPVYEHPGIGGFLGDTAAFVGNKMTPISFSQGAKALNIDRLSQAQGAIVAHPASATQSFLGINKPPKRVNAMFNNTGSAGRRITPVR